MLLAAEWDTATFSSLNWTNATDCCGGKWHGVTCTAEQTAVTSIHLPGVGIEGLFPSAWSKLPLLEALNLSANHLFGNMSGCDDGFSALRALDVTSNLLEGP